ncbi:UTP--glucose-1-phosphate uridylyltransferase GalU [Aliidiomarina halalkaliphila]|uniref:UTP--glucose-1-phosphate uridylyltransferase n=1 Tax=Aliidiomarina halalkaliphila TaxID=2593535 RepID=A0A552X5N4_9GAMM|nr:UTP--glucose-1-phosphate uridylyltransferase GalU [Aliidiomarina halalkaliphila]TRW50269.1 UTP--glucose-1-phosphate uridylyltransferase GalU [Aliidiomarina halalkaliphila]
MTTSYPHGRVTKAIIPVAGLGTRMLPATKAIPKEMLPLVDKPLIQYIVNECVAAGITEIVLVTHASKGSIENHFDVNHELESTLAERNKQKLLDEVRAICPVGITITAVRQGVAKGLGHAVLCGRPVVGNEPFAVVLPDVLIDEYTHDPRSENLAEMIRNYESSGASQVMLEQVPQDRVDQYGIADLDGVQIKPREQTPIKALVEKPKVAEAPSNLAVVGRYVFSGKLWPLLEKTPPGAGNEIQLTDAMAMLLEQDAVHAYYMQGRSHDCGNKLGYLQTIVAYGERHPELGEAFKSWLASR